MDQHPGEWDPKHGRNSTAQVHAAQTSGSGLHRSRDSRPISRKRLQSVGRPRGTPNRAGSSTGATPSSAQRPSTSSSATELCEPLGMQCSTIVATSSLRSFISPNWLSEACASTASVYSIISSSHGSKMTTDGPCGTTEHTLSVLDEEFVDIDWLHKRATATSTNDLRVGGPPAWQRYQAGKLDRLQFRAPLFALAEAQLPATGSNDAMVLRQLVEMSPTEFEGAVVSLFRELDDVRHTINRTQPSKDGGFDFFGKFVLPPPVGYEIDFLGEVKKFQATTAVQPKHVSRLVARLGRGQYGFFVTTSYYTKQTQEEVLADGYPAWLIAGADVVNMMRQLRIAHGPSISPTWLEAVAEEMRIGLFNRN